MSYQHRKPIENPTGVLLAVSASVVASLGAAPRLQRTRGAGRRPSHRDERLPGLAKLVALDDV